MENELTNDAIEKLAEQLPDYEALKRAPVLNRHQRRASKHTKGYRGSGVGKKTMAFIQRGIDNNRNIIVVKKNPITKCVANCLKKS